MADGISAVGVLCYLIATTGDSFHCFIGSENELPGAAFLDLGGLPKLQSEPTK
jgi:hypothetical protein